MTDHGVKRRYGRYILATTIYMIGVVAICIWSYIDQRQGVLKRLDSTLIHATYAVREIMDDGQAENPALIDNPDTPDYAARQAKLGRLARKSGLALLGAALHQNDETYALIAESGNPGIIPFGDVKYGDSLPLRVKRSVLDLARSSDQGIASLNINHLDYGLFRMVLFYKAQSDGTGRVYFAAQEFESAASQLRWYAKREAVAGLLLILMALVMVRIRNTIEKRVADELTELNEQLNRDIGIKQQREKELEAAIQDLERFSAVATGREGRILQLKAEINSLLVQLNREKRYNSTQAD